jgi:hypothetical protein
MGPWYVFDPHIYHRGRPGSRRTVDGVEYAYNSAGFRDIERALKKPQDVVRVALIGDSCVEGYECPFEDSIGPTLQRLVDSDDALTAALRRYGMRAIEVIPFGLQGFAPTHYWKLLEGDVLAYEPDLVYVNVFSFNDIAALVPFRERVRSGSYRIPYGDYYSLHDGSLKLERSCINEYREYMRAQTRAWLRAAVQARARRLPGLRTRPRARAAGSVSMPDNDWTAGYSWTQAKGLFAYAAAEQESERAYQIAKALLDRMRETADRSGARLFTVHLANADIIDPDLLEAELAVWRRFEAGQGARDYDYSRIDPELPIQRLRADLDLNQLWKGAEWRDLFVFRGLKWGHLKPSGNRLWAGSVLEHLHTALPEYLASAALGEGYADEYDPYAYPLY